MVSSEDSSGDSSSDSDWGSLTMGIGGTNGIGSPSGNTATSARASPSAARSPPSLVAWATAPRRAAETVSVMNLVGKFLEVLPIVARVVDMGLLADDGREVFLPAIVKLLIFKYIEVDDTRPGGIRFTTELVVFSKLVPVETVLGTIAGV